VVSASVKSVVGAHGTSVSSYVRRVVEVEKWRRGTVGYIRLS